MRGLPRTAVVLQTVVVIAAAWLIWRAYRLPLYGAGHVLYRDDVAVLSERAWLESNTQWLRHLLFFNQTRFTERGDYVLVRPLLFTMTWLADVLFRSNRDAHYVLSMAISMFALLVLVRLGQRSGLPLVMTLPLASAFFLLRSDTVLLTWSHINPYLFALALPILGMLRITRTDEDRIDWPAILLFAVATGFHEAAPLGLLATGVIAFFLTRRDRKWFAFHFLVPGALYLLVYATVMLVYRPPIGSEAASSPAPGEQLLRIADAVLRFVYDMVDTLPILWIDNLLLRLAGAAIFWIAVCAAIAWFIRHSRSSAFFADRWLLASIGLHFGALFGGYAVTRFGTRPLQTWYLQMGLYYLLAAALVVFGLMFRTVPRGRAWQVIGVALTAMLWVANYAASAVRAQASEQVWRQYSARYDVARTVLRHLERTNTCFAGSMTPPGPFPELSDTLSILLYYESCSVLRDRKPAYFRLVPTKVSAFTVSGWAPVSAYKPLPVQRKPPCVLSPPMTFTEYHARLTNRGSFPYRYPMTLSIDYGGTARRTLELEGNEYRLDWPRAQGHLLRIGETMDLKVLRGPDGFGVFAGEQLLVMLPQYDDAVQVSLCGPDWIGVGMAYVP